MKIDKIITVLKLVFIWSAVAAVLAMPAAATQNTMYFSIDGGSVPVHCESIDIDLMADVNESNPIVAISVNITFDPNCVEITNWAGNTNIWTEGTTSTISSSLQDGYLFITAIRMESISGDLSIGTLTLRNKSNEDCGTDLNFSTGEFTTGDLETLYPSFNNDIFNCTTDSPEGGQNLPVPGSGFIFLAGMLIAAVYFIKKRQQD